MWHRASRRQRTSRIGDSAHSTGDGYAELDSGSGHEAKQGALEVIPLASAGESKKGKGAQKGKSKEKDGRGPEAKQGAFECNFQPPTNVNFLNCRLLYKIPSPLTLSNTRMPASA